MKGNFKVFNQTYGVIFSMLSTSNLRRTELAAVDLTCVAAWCDYWSLSKQTNVRFLVIKHRSCHETVEYLKCVKSGRALLCCVWSSHCPSCPRWPVSLGWKWHHTDTVGTLLSRKWPPVFMCVCVWICSQGRKPTFLTTGTITPSSPEQPSGISHGWLAAKLTASPG